MDAASTATDAVTHAGDLLPGTAPRIQQQLYRAFDLQALYNKNLHQVTIHVTITDSTPPPAVAAIIAAAGDPAAASTPDPARPHFSDLAQAPIRGLSTTIVQMTGRHAPSGAAAARPTPGRAASPERSQPRPADGTLVRSGPDDGPWGSAGGRASLISSCG